MKKLTLTLYKRQLGERSLTLSDGRHPSFVPKFKHLMLGNNLVEIWFPEDYYTTNQELLERLEFDTNLYIKRLQDDN
jgi:hypothetical protein